MTMVKSDMKAQMKVSMGGVNSVPRTKQSIFGDKESPQQDVTPTEVKPVTQNGQPSGSTKTKADIFTERVTLVISTEQREMVERLARKLQKNRVKKSERITSNTVIRCLISLLEKFEGDISTIDNEESLAQLMKDHFTKR